MDVLRVRPAKVQAFIDRVIGDGTTASKSHHAKHKKHTGPIDSKCIN